MFCIYVLYVHKRCPSLPHLLLLPLSPFILSHFLLLRRFFFPLPYYVYVQALRTRVSEAYTELDEPTFARKKLEGNIVFERLFQRIPGQQQRSSLR